jgi:hypothetical protein
MEGTIAPLGELRQVCDEYGAGLIADEAHALRVFGREGAGVCRADSVVADVVVGTFGKAVGVQGAFVASDAAAAEWLWYRARSFALSTGVSPALAGKVLENVMGARFDEAPSAACKASSAQPLENVRGCAVRRGGAGASARERFAVSGAGRGGGAGRASGVRGGPIVPVIVGAAEACVEVGLRRSRKVRQGCGSRCVPR